MQPSTSSETPCSSLSYQETALRPGPCQCGSPVGSSSQVLVVPGIHEDTRAKLGVLGDVGTWPAAPVPPPASKHNGPSCLPAAAHGAAALTTGPSPSTSTSSPASSPLVPQALRSAWSVQGSGDSSAGVLRSGGDRSGQEWTLVDPIPAAGPMTDSYTVARQLVMRAGCAAAYRSDTRTERVAFKLPGLQPSDLPANWSDPLRAALEQRGLQLVNTYVRQGCVHILLDVVAHGAITPSDSREAGSTAAAAAGDTTATAGSMELASAVADSAAAAAAPAAGAAAAAGAVAAVAEHGEGGPTAPDASGAAAGAGPCSGLAGAGRGEGGAQAGDEQGLALSLSPEEWADALGWDLLSRRQVLLQVFASPAAGAGSLREGTPSMGASAPGSPALSPRGSAGPAYAAVLCAGEPQFMLKGLRLHGGAQRPAHAHGAGSGSDSSSDSEQVTGPADNLGPWQAPAGEADAARRLQVVPLPPETANDLPNLTAVLPLAVAVPAAASSSSSCSPAGLVLHAVGPRLLGAPQGQLSLNAGPSAAAAAGSAATDGLASAAGQGAGPGREAGHVSKPHTRSSKPPALAVYVRSRGSYLPAKVARYDPGSDPNSTEQDPGVSTPTAAAAAVGFGRAAPCKQEVLRIEVPAGHVPTKPGLLFVECQRGHMLGNSKPVVVAPSLAVAQELCSLSASLAQQPAHGSAADAGAAAAEVAVAAAAGGGACPSWADMLLVDLGMLLELLCDQALQSQGEAPCASASPASPATTAGGPASANLAARSNSGCGSSVAAATAGGSTSDSDGGLASGLPGAASAGAWAWHTAVRLLGQAMCRGWAATTAMLADAIAGPLACWAPAGVLQAGGAGQAAHVLGMGSKQLSAHASQASLVQADALLLAEEGLSLLHMAVRSGKVEVVEALLAACAKAGHAWDACTPGLAALTPLHLAAVLPDAPTAAAVVDRLLAAGGVPAVVGWYSSTTFDGSTPCGMALATGNAPAVQAAEAALAALALRHGLPASPVSEAGSSLGSVLSWAAGQQLLRQHRLSADANGKQEEGRPSMSQAATTAGVEARNPSSPPQQNQGFMGDLFSLTVRAPCPARAAASSGPPHAAAHSLRAGSGGASAPAQARAPCAPHPWTGGVESCPVGFGSPEARTRLHGLDMPDTGASGISHALGSGASAPARSSSPLASVFGHAWGVGRLPFMTQRQAPAQGGMLMVVGGSGSGVTGASSSPEPSSVPAASGGNGNEEPGQSADPLNHLQPAALHDGPLARHQQLHHKQQAKPSVWEPAAHVESSTEIGTDLFMPAMVSPTAAEQEAAAAAGASLGGEPSWLGAHEVAVAAGPSAGPQHPASNAAAPAARARGPAPGQQLLQGAGQEEGRSGEPYAPHPGLPTPLWGQEANSRALAVLQQTSDTSTDHSGASSRPSSQSSPGGRHRPSMELAHVLLRHAPSAESDWDRGYASVLLDSHGRGSMESTLWRAAWGSGGEREGGSWCTAPVQGAHGEVESCQVRLSQLEPCSRSSPELPSPEAEGSRRSSHASIAMGGRGGEAGASPGPRDAPAARKRLVVARAQAVAAAACDAAASFEHALLSRLGHGPYLRLRMLRFTHDGPLEARYVRSRAHGQAGSVDLVASAFFMLLTLLPMVQLVVQAQLWDLVAHLAFNATWLAPYLVLLLVRQRYEGSRDALMAACEGVAKLGTMLLVLLGVLTYPGAWKEFSARYTDAIMLCLMKPLAVQVRAPLALVIHATALLPDAHMYAVLVYGCTAQGWACSLLRSLLQNSFALCLHGLLDMRARMVFLRQHGRGTTRKQPQQQYLAVQSNDREAVPQGAAVQQQGRGEHAGHGKEKQL